MSTIVNYYQAVLDALSLVMGMAENFFSALGQFLGLLFEAMALPNLLQYYLPNIIVLSMFSVVGAGVIKIILGR